MTLTPTEEAVLAFMTKFQRVTKRPPTMAEIQYNCPWLAWRSSVRYVLVSLLEKGKLELVAPANYSRRYGVKPE